MAHGTVNIEDVRAASVRLASVIRRTPLEYSRTLSDLTGSRVYLKLENLQRTGSFKVRGAYNCLAVLGEEGLPGGVVAASAGNHAQGVALAASLAGREATVVMPRTAPVSKVTATAGYGAHVVLTGETWEEARAAALDIAGESGAFFVHAFDDPRVIAGQGTLGLELLAGCPDLDAVLVPVGGGGLAAGVGLAVKSCQPGVRVIGVQAAGAPGACLSHRAGQVIGVPAATFADGIDVQQPGELAFSLLRQHVDEMVLVEERDIAGAILLLLERAKLVVEGAGAVGVAALLAGRVDLAGKNVAVVLSGGNIDMNAVSVIIDRGLAAAGRTLTYRTRVADRPGNLQQLLALVAARGANVISVYHDRLCPEIPLKEAVVTLTMETRDHGHVAEIRETLTGAGFTPTEAGTC